MPEPTTIGPPPLCPGTGQFAPMSCYTFYGVCIECGGCAFHMPDGTAGPHWRGGVDPENPQCLNRGSYVPEVGSPFCVRPQSHAGPHRAHESWGEVTW